MTSSIVSLLLEHLLVGVKSLFLRSIYSFRTGQELELFPYITPPSGKVHFAGEHTTLTHGWMQGAIESGIRVAYEVNEQ